MKGPLKDQLHTFAFPMAGGVFQDFRVVVRDDIPWFFVSDVCAGLGYKVKPSKGYATTAPVLNRLSTCEIATHFITGRRGAGFKVVSYKGLSELLIRSNKGGADFMREWVDKLVLPKLPEPPQEYLEVEALPTTPTPAASEEEVILKAMATLEGRIKEDTARLEALKTAHHTLYGSRA